MNIRELGRSLIFLTAAAIFGCGTAFASDISPDLPLPLEQCWVYQIADLNLDSSGSDEDRVYLTTTSARIEAVSAASGERLWSSELGGEIVSNIGIASGNLFVITRTASGASPGSLGQLRSLSKDTGITNWSVAVPADGRFRLGLSGSRLIALSDSGRVAAFATATGHENWNANVEGLVPAASAFEDDDFVVGSRGKLILFSTGTGKVITKISAPYSATAVTFLRNGEIAWGDERGNLLAYETGHDRLKWKLKRGAGVSDLFFNGNTLFAASLDNFVYSVVPENGKIRWKRRQEGQPTGIAAWRKSEYLAVSNTGGISVSILAAHSGKTLSQVNPKAENDFMRVFAVAGETLVLATGSGISGYRVGVLSEKAARR